MCDPCPVHYRRPLFADPCPARCPQFPVDGYFTFVLEPYGTVIGEAGIIVDEAQGVGTATIVKDPKEDGIYGIPPPGEYQGARTLACNDPSLNSAWIHGYRGRLSPSTLQHCTHHACICQPCL